MRRAPWCGRNWRALLEQAGLLDGDLAQRAIRREGDEIGMGGEEQRIVVALIGGPFLARGHGFEVVRKAEIVALDEVGAAQQAGAEPAREGGLAHAFGTGEQEGLRQAVLRQHLLERLDGARIAPEVIEQISG